MNEIVREVVIISIEDIKDTAKEYNYGEIICPWDSDDLEECGSFDIFRQEVETELAINPDGKFSAWNRSCLKIMDEENENQLVLVKEKTNETCSLVDISYFTCIV